MDIKIIVATHKFYWMHIDRAYLPLQIGASGAATLGCERDDTGTDISIKNSYYCELIERDSAAYRFACWHFLCDELSR